MTSLIEKYTRGSTRLIGHVEADMESLLRRKKCLLLDGGLATELERRGHPIQVRLFACVCSCLLWSQCSVRMTIVMYCI